MINTQFTLYLENRPGALALVAEALADAGVNIEGVSAATSADVGLVQLIVSHAAKAASVFKKRKIPFTIQQVAVVALPNRPGELARISERLAKSKVNINYLYGTSSADQCTLVISAGDIKRVERLCR